MGTSNNTKAFIYATSKLDAAAVMAASLGQDVIPAYNLGFVSAAYTTAHEAMELLLKVYLIRGPMALPREEVRGHDLGKLFYEVG